MIENVFDEQQKYCALLVGEDIDQVPSMMVFAARGLSLNWAITSRL